MSSLSMTSLRLQKGRVTWIGNSQNFPSCTLKLQEDNTLVQCIKLQHQETCSDTSTSTPTQYLSTWATPEQERVYLFSRSLSLSCVSMWTILYLFGIVQTHIRRSLPASKVVFYVPRANLSFQESLFDPVQSTLKVLLPKGGLTWS